MRKFILGLGLLAVVVVFVGCDDLQSNPPKPKEKTTMEIQALDEQVTIRNRYHTVSLLCKDNLEYIVLSQIKAVAITPHWIVKNGTQQIKTCN